MTLKLFRFLVVATYLLTITTRFATASQQLIVSELPLVPGLAKTHGVLMAITFVIVFPTGAILLRLLKLKGSAAVAVHAAIQLSGWALMIAGLAEGIRLANIIASLENNYHTIFGTVIVVLALLQPFFGFLHHRYYLAAQKRERQPRAGLLLVHRWYGRVLIILGIVNGGLGLRFAHNTHGGKIVYGVIAGLAGLTMCALAFVVEYKGPRIRGEETKDQNPTANEHVEGK